MSLISGCIFRTLISRHLHVLCLHYDDVIMSATAFQIKAPRMFTQPCILEQIKENNKSPRHWSLWGEFTGDRWIPHTKGQQRGKRFHLMTSSWYNGTYIMSRAKLVMGNIWYAIQDAAFELSALQYIAIWTQIAIECQIIVAKITFCEKLRVLIR